MPTTDSRRMEHAPRRWRIAVGALIQETNSFSPSKTDIENFRAGTLLFGDEIVPALRRTGTEVAGFLDSLADGDVEALPTVVGWASTAGPIRPDDRDALVGHLLASIGRLHRDHPIDGVLIGLHGSWLSEDDDDLDGTVLERLRERLGPSVPIVATLDLHANVTERMVRAADALVGYATYPHTDMRQTGQRAGRILIQTLVSGNRTRVLYRRVPMIVAPENAQTAAGPLAIVKAAEAELGRTAGVHATSCFCVQPWLDVPEVGCTVVAVVDRNIDPSAERMVVDSIDRVASVLWSVREAITVPLVPPDDAVAAAYSADDHILITNPDRLDRRGPVLLVDSADSPSAGAGGDSSTILRALLRAPYSPGDAYLTIVDPPAAAVAAQHDGRRIEVQLGGAIDAERFAAVTFGGTVRVVSPSVFHFGSGVGDGLRADMGPAAVIVGDDGPHSRPGLQVVVMSNPVPCYDPAIFAAADLDVAAAAVVVVKSATNFRWTYRHIARGWIYVDTPGAASPRLTSLPYRRLPRPLWPWDDAEGDRPAPREVGHRASHERARTVLPGGVTAGARANVALGHPFYVTGARGATVTDVSGRVLIDLVTSNGAALLGHAHPSVREALRRAAADGMACAYDGPEQIALAERLCELIPAYEQVRFTSSGTEATFYAVRLARAATGRTLIAKFEGHFHGYNDPLAYSMWPSPDEAQSGPEGTPRAIPESAGLPVSGAAEVVVLPFNDPTAFQRLLRDRGDELAAVIVEPVNFDAGCIMPLPGFLETVRDETRRRGIVLIFDEILSGFRTGVGGAQAYLGITPDLATVGKALAGGVPLSAFGGRRDIMEHVSPLGRAVHTGTYNAHPLPIAAAHAFLDLATDQNFYPELTSRCALLERLLVEAFGAAGLPVRIQGLGARFAMYFGLPPDVEVTGYRQAARYDRDVQRSWCREVVARGIYSTPVWHHGISAAHDDHDVHQIAEAAFEAARAVVESPRA